MASQEALDVAYMQCAFAIAELSRARRKKVGAILVANAGGIIAEGFNGTPSGFPNECEDVESIPHDLEQDHVGWWYCKRCGKAAERKIDPWIHSPCQEKLTTKSECVHAESNAIAKVARSNNSAVGATLYCTLTPCFECAKLIIQAGIFRVVYAEQYPYSTHTGPARALGLELLAQARIKIDKLEGFK